MSYAYGVNPRRVRRTRAGRGRGARQADVVTNAGRRGIVAMSALIARDMLARQIGQTAYSGEREYYRILGYPSALNVVDYLQRYERQDIASRIVDLPAQDTWKKPPTISEEGEDDTPFVQAWQDMAKRVRIWSKFSRADRLAGIGRFGVLLLGLRGGALLDEVENGSLSSQKDLLYLRPFSEASVKIAEQEKDSQSPRFGLPTIYSIKIDDELGWTDVHWTRVLHIADNKLDSEIYGVPRLQRVFNRLEDMMKLVGGSAEATWLSMRRGLIFKTQDGYSLDNSTDAAEDRENQLEEYAHDIARFLTLEGMDVADLGGAVVDPSGPFQVVLSVISAASGIPQRVLIGSAQGELAAAEWDVKQWYGVIASRQVNFAEPEILRTFIDRMIMYGALPAPTAGYDVGVQTDEGEWVWPSLFEQSELENAQVSLARAQTAAALSDALADYPITEGEMRQLVGFPEAAEEDATEPVVPPSEPDDMGEIEDGEEEEDFDTPRLPE